MSLNETKTCKVCGQSKPIDEFQIYRLTHRRGYCYQCHLDKKKRYYEENKEAVLASQKDYAARNRETVLAKAKRYRGEHQERYREYNRLYWALTKGEQEAKRKAKYAANPELKRRKVEATLDWQRQNPDRVNAKKHRRRARIKGAGGTYTAEEWAALKERYGNCCLRCDRREPEITLTVDHVVPISKGGTNTVDNIQPLCRSCNSTKHTDIVDYRPQKDA